MKPGKEPADRLSDKFKKTNANDLDCFETDEKLIIALDFGTTFSGIAFCFANQRDTKVAAIMDWPGSEGESAPKIPTLINYHSSNPKEFAWGSSVNRRNDNIVGVKLLLDPEQERPLHLPTGNIKRDIKNLPKKPVYIAADFIGAIYRHALSEIAKTVPKKYMSMCQKHFVLSGWRLPLYICKQ
jgi:molecular chaperone DnaK (HSP70)